MASDKCHSDALNSYCKRQPLSRTTSYGLSPFWECLHFWDTPSEALIITHQRVAARESYSYTVISDDQTPMGFVVC